MSEVGASEAAASRTLNAFIQISYIFIHLSTSSLFCWTCWWLLLFPSSLDFMLWHSNRGSSCRMHFRQHGAKRFALQCIAEVVWRKHIRPTSPFNIFQHRLGSRYVTIDLGSSCVSQEGQAISLNVVRVADNQIDYKHLYCIKLGSKATEWQEPSVCVGAPLFFFCVRFPYYTLWNSE